MKTARHIQRLRRECSRIQEHGHCKDQAQFVAVSDVEIAVGKLEEAFGWQESMKNKKRKEKK